MSRRRILDDPEAFRRAWNDLPLGDRRRISRAVSKGTPLDDEVEAQLAVMTARRQVTFWSWAWLVGPAVSFVQFGNKEIGLILAAAGISAVATGLLAIWFIRRARAAEEANLPRALHAANRGAPHPKSKEAQRLSAGSDPERPRRWRRK